MTDHVSTTPANDDPPRPEIQSQPLKSRRTQSSEDASLPRVSVLYQALMDTLDSREQAAVLDALKRHEEEVRAADAAGLRAPEAT
jgi:hypothetical protein